MVVRTQKSTGSRIIIPRAEVVQSLFSLFYHTCRPVSRKTRSDDFSPSSSNSSVNKYTLFASNRSLFFILCVFSTKNRKRHGGKNSPCLKHTYQSYIVRLNLVLSLAIIRILSFERARLYLVIGFSEFEYTTISKRE